MWGKYIARTSYVYRYFGDTMGANLIYYFRNFLFHLFFWGCFHSMLSPTIELSGNWPPKRIALFNLVHFLFQLPYTPSGLLVTWTNQGLIGNHYRQALKSLSITIIRGIYSTLFPGFEHLEAAFIIYNSVYGSWYVHSNLSSWITGTSSNILLKSLLNPGYLKPLVINTWLWVWRLVLTLCRYCTIIPISICLLVSWGTCLV